MTEQATEKEQEIEIQEKTDESEETQEATVEETEGTEEDKKGTDFAEFRDSKDRARFERIYGHMKENERVVTQLVEDNKALVQEIGEIKKSGSERDLKSQIRGLNNLKKQALEEGNFDKVIQIDDKIMDLRTQSITATTTNDHAAVTQTAARPSDTQTMGSPSGSLTVEQEAQLDGWAAEIDDTGNFKRPWAREGHPLQKKAAAIGAAVFEDAAIVSQGIPAILGEIDRLMSKETKTASKPAVAAVLSGGADVRPNAGKEVKLTEEEKFIADKMGFSNKEYQEAIKKHRSIV